MSAAGDAPDLGDRLAAEIDRFDPFEALRLIEAFGLPAQGDGRGEGTADGEDVPEPPLAVGAVTSRHVATPFAAPGTFGLGRRGLPEVAFVGLAGPLGPLPPVYTEVALRERRARSPGLAAFLDLFLARATAAFLDADEKYRLSSRIARRGIDGGDRITEALRALAGLMLPAHRGRLATPDAELLPYAGLLGRSVRSGAGLEVLLADRLGLPVRIAPFQVRRLPIVPEEQTRLSGPRPAYGRLGVDAVAGAGVLDATSTFRVVVGPVGATDFAGLAPGGARMAELVELVRLYMDPGLDFDVQVILRKEDVPEAQLGARPPSLGWNAWLRQLPAERDADQSVFDPTSRVP
ncbi:type VI secretion system baseplate subunit TssG [Methylobacterium platani]|uniref:Type VI secretion protein n=1 Tax=Methylobacterium platani TaxID=427683 RepID=A0A179S9B7_9HYPH|nr:type VI secretion system baseplate subunit TssG [Methylobacterium platani]OAS24292.1 hypothetical protein A5481_14635 [Methylobacterium platani]